MGAFLSRVWSEIAHLMGWQILMHTPQGASQNDAYNERRGSTVVDDTTGTDTLMEDSSSVLKTTATDGTSLRQRVKKTPEREVKDVFMEPPSPMKSKWEETAEHPKPQLDAVPPTKKSKNDKTKTERCLPLAEEMKFESVPNVHFGTNECPQSLSPDYDAAAPNGFHNGINGHTDDKPPEGPRLPMSRKAEPREAKTDDLASKQKVDGISGTKREFGVDLTSAGNVDNGARGDCVAGGEFKDSDVDCVKTSIDHTPSDISPMKSLKEEDREAPPETDTKSDIGKGSAINRSRPIVEDPSIPHGGASKQDDDEKKTDKEDCAVASQEMSENQAPCQENETKTQECDEEQKMEGELNPPPTQDVSKEQDMDIDEDGRKNEDVNPTPRAISCDSLEQEKDQSSPNEDPKFVKAGPKLVDYTSSDTDLDLAEKKSEAEKKLPDYEREKLETSQSSDMELEEDTAQPGITFPPTKDNADVDLLSASATSDMELTGDLPQEDSDNDRGADMTGEKEAVLVEESHNLEENLGQITEDERVDTTQHKSNASEDIAEQQQVGSQIQPEAQQVQSCPNIEISVTDPTGVALTADIDHGQEAEEVEVLANGDSKSTETETEDGQNAPEKSSSKIISEKSEPQTVKNDEEKAENSDKNVAGTPQKSPGKEVEPETTKNIQKQSEYDTENAGISPQKSPAKSGPKNQVSVQWSGNAQEVFITGSWVNWSDRIRLVKAEENIWTVDLELDQDLKEIELKFVVDGVWLTSPDMPSVDDGSGNRNNIIRLLH